MNTSHHINQPDSENTAGCSDENLREPKQKEFAQAKCFGTDELIEASTPAIQSGNKEAQPGALIELSAEQCEGQAAPAVLGIRAVRLKRGADFSFDCIWTRNHAICLMGAICDHKLGGYEAARETPEPLKSGVRPPEIAPIVLALCPWILRSDYLNFDGLKGVREDGIEGYFCYWSSNRVTYFYRHGQSGEHPHRRRKANLREVYREFYDTFAEDIATRTPISEEQARGFWLSVSDRVPFLQPRIVLVKATPPDAECPSDPPVSADEGELRSSDDAGQEGGAE